MGKSKLTREIEKSLIGRFNDTQLRYANEVASYKYAGVIDLVTADFYYENKYPVMTTYEIKISVSDFKSKNGHNHIGDYSYYVVPKSIYQKIKPLVQENIGIIVYNEETQTLRTNKKALKQNVLSVEDKFQVLNKILLRWCSGSMNAELEIMGYKQKNGLSKCKKCGKTVRNYNLMGDSLCFDCFVNRNRIEIKGNIF